MNRVLSYAAPLFAVLALAACNAGGSSNMPASPGQSSPTNHSVSMPQWQAKGLAHAACPQVVGKPTCLALISNKVPPPCAPSSTCGWTPTDLQTVYKLPSGTNGAGQVVAIVDFFDNPNVANDLAAYRTQFGLGTANFTKYNEHGQVGNYPQGSPGWGAEIDLDVEMVSATCPKCTIDLIEAAGDDNGELAEATAVSLGAHVVTNSWSCPGSPTCGDPNFAQAFNVPGVLFLASSGDSGYGSNNIGGPADLGTVVAVGGTQLKKSGSVYSESAWADGGAGCATGVTKPSWQHDTGCTSRTQTDVSSEGGCSPGVAFYDTYQSGGWGGICGTSVSSPSIAGVYALAGNASKQNAAQNLYKLKNKKRKKELHDITTGSDGSCGGSYLCTAMKGYDGPTGWGTPNGIKAF
ncbi:MAG: hypothetical protein WA814_00150 [Candidatus Baltobacteraceae bacterium]